MTAGYELLQAGPLTATWDPTNGGLRWIRCGDRELVRGVYGAVRDQHWGTVEPLLSDVEIRRDEHSFLVTFKARLHAGDIDYEWTGAIGGEADGVITCSFNGLARSRFLRQRIGLCVLHPIRECRGQRCQIVHTSGAVEQSAYPGDVSPHQPFKDIAAIIQKLDDRTSLKIAFDGETFETEDQRNWTDASFKTYGTPLDRPRPVWVEPGDLVRQQIEIRLETDARPPSAPASGTVELQSGRDLTLPRLGFEISPAFDAADSDLRDQLQSLQPDHLRLPLELDSEQADDRLLAAADLARQLGATLHVALTLGEEPARALARLASKTAGRPLPVAVWIVLHRDEASTSSHWVERAREHLHRAAPLARFGGGTDQNFAELNRDRRPRAGFDIVSFAINPQVHAFDDDSIAETLEAQPDAVATARSFVGELPIIAGPIVLEPRFGFDGQPRTALDPRLSQSFSAAWTLGSIAALASAGTSFATYFEATGPRGLFARPDGPPSPAVQVFADLAELRRARWRILESARPTAVLGLECQSPGRRGALVANPGASVVRIRLPFDVVRRRMISAPSPSADWLEFSDREFDLPPRSVVRVEGRS